MLRSRSLSMMPILSCHVCDIDHIGLMLSADNRDRAAVAPSVAPFPAGAPRARRELVCKGSSTMGKRRLDTLLAERGLFPSRSRAAASVMAGEVRVGAGDRRAAKPSELVDVEERLSVQAQPQFVSRGGIKLANALAACGLEVGGRLALDVGASTGGFTDCLLQRGAREVIAVDVGYGILDYRLRSDARVSVLERTNARALTPALVSAARAGAAATAADSMPDLATVDVSFISLAKVLGAVLGCMAGGYDVLALVKPQFELGRGRVGKGGVVRSPDDRREALIGAGEAALSAGAAVVGYYSSELPGPKGNRETFVWLTDPAGARGSRERARLEQLAREVAP
jgi:23S rRNA (cytidine1920-2'-O)/16S rRNA (cytidine1409-2'-O)-methyltransferase